MINNIYDRQGADNTERSALQTSIRPWTMGKSELLSIILKTKIKSKRIIYTKKKKKISTVIAV